MNGLLNQQPESFFHLWIYQSTSDRNAWYALTVRGTNPWTLKRYEAGMCIGLFWSLYNANRFHVAVDLFSDRSQRTSKCGKRHQRLVCHLSFFYHILTSSVIYHWTDARQHGMCLLNSKHVPESWGAYHLTEKSGWRVESIMVSDLPVYRRNATSVPVWIQKRANLCCVSLEPRRNREIG